MLHWIVASDALPIFVVVQRVVLTYAPRVTHPLISPLVCLMLQAPADQPSDVSARLRRACDMAAAADS